MTATTEAFSRVKMDGLLKDAGWILTDGVSVLFEHALADGTQADDTLCDRSRRPMAAFKAKHAGIDSIGAQDLGCHYTKQLDAPFALPGNMAGSAYGKAHFPSVAKRTTGIASINKPSQVVFLC